MLGLSDRDHFRFTGVEGNEVEAVELLGANIPLVPTVVARHLNLRVAKVSVSGNHDLARSVDINVKVDDIFLPSNASTFQESSGITRPANSSLECHTYSCPDQLD